MTGELTKRAACREYDLHWQTLEKILADVEPPGYRRTKPRRKPKIEPFLPIIRGILESDRTAPEKIAAAVEANVRWSLRQLADHPACKKLLAEEEGLLAGGVYELGTGLVRFLDD